MGPWLASWGAAEGAAVDAIARVSGRSHEQNEHHLNMRALQPKGRVQFLRRNSRKAAVERRKSFVPGFFALLSHYIYDIV